VRTAIQIHADVGDVAKRMGVSVMTVSNLVNESSDLVREGARDGVLRAIQALGC